MKEVKPYSRYIFTPVKLDKTYTLNFKTKFEYLIKILDDKFEWLDKFIEEEKELHQCDNFELELLNRFDNKTQKLCFLILLLQNLDLDNEELRNKYKQFRGFLYHLYDK